MRDMKTARPGRLGWTLGLTAAAYFMVVLDALVVITALPQMQHDLRASLGSLQWTVNAYGIAFAAGIISAAALGDRFGRRRVFGAGLLLFTAASAACALAPGIGALIAARTVQGLGAAVVLPLSLTILTTAYPAERRGAIVGIYGGLAGLAVAVGPLIGGAVTQDLDWHWIFWINVPVGIVAVALGARLLPESYGAPERLDPVGVALVTTGVVPIVWGLVRANGIGWSSTEVAGSLAAGCALLVAFVAWERRATAPMVPLRLFRSRDFALGNATTFFLHGATFAMSFLVTQEFQFARGYSPLATGLRLLPFFATPMFVAPVAGALSDRIGRRPVMLAGLALQVVGFTWVAARSSLSTSWLELGGALLVAGIGVSMALPTVPTVVLDAVAPDEMGKASGINAMFQRFGTVFAVAIADAVFSAHGHLGTPAAVTAGFRPALWVCVAFAALAAGFAVAITSSHQRVTRKDTNMPDILHRISIDAPQADVHQLVTTNEGIERWWTNAPVGGNAAVGEELRIHITNPDKPAAVMEVVSEQPDEVVWRCVDGPDDWRETRVTFSLKPTQDGGTTLLFTHAGWRKAGEFMAGCSTNWCAYLTSLKAGAEGQGFRPYPAGEISRW